MKKAVAILAAVIVCLCALFSGCTPTYDKSPDQYSKIRWITYDYSFCIKPDDGCKGFYKFNDKKYNIQVTFDSSRLTAADIDNKNAELFTADWMYDKNDAGSEILYVYNIMFNKKDYKEFENNFAEHASLKKEKV
ncbi:MAG: hypothetical protein IIU14_06155 [Ruminococcus sp.]|nr:hypothetical protein [Ruminococcus sp.]